MNVNIKSVKKRHFFIFALGFFCLSASTNVFKGQRTSSTQLNMSAVLYTTSQCI